MNNPLMNNVHYLPNNEVFMYVTYILSCDKNIPFYVGAGNIGRPYKNGQGSKCHKDILKIINEHHSRGSDIIRTIAATFETKSEAFEYEIMLISKFGKRSSGGLLLNICDGGLGIKGYKFPDVHRKQMSDRMKIYMANVENRLKLSESLKSVMKNKEIRKTISDKLKEKWKNDEFRSKCVNSHTGLKDSELTKKRKAVACSKSWNDGKRKGKYTDEEIKDIYDSKGKWDVHTLARKYGMNPTYIHKIWRHERCRMALKRIGVLS